MHATPPAGLCAAASGDLSHNSLTGRVTTGGVELAAYSASLVKRMSLKRTLMIDLAVAATLVAFVLVAAPGVAIVGLLALLVLVAGCAGLAIELWQQRG